MSNNDLPILKEIDELAQSQEIELAPDNDDDKPVRVRVTPLQRRQIITEFLEGIPKQDIAKKYGIPTRSVTLIIDKSPDDRLELEKRHEATALSRENYRLTEAKNKLISFISDTLDEVSKDPTCLTTEAKIKVFNNVAAVFDKLSITSRLNAEKPTNISENRKVIADISKIMEQLPSPQDKLDFLRKQRPNKEIVYDTTATEL